jgi:hypothetical protein
MAYCIFLKSLRILEEFRKNLCVKIPPKSPCVNFPSLGKFKNPIFISKRISLQFQHSRPSCPAGLFGLSAQPVKRPAYQAGPPAVDPLPPPFSNSSRRSRHCLLDASPTPCVPPPLSHQHHGAPTTSSSPSELDCPSSMDRNHTPSLS